MIRVLLLQLNPKTWKVELHAAVRCPQYTSNMNNDQKRPDVRKIVLSIKFRRNPKGDGGKGTGKKTSRQFATNVTTIFDILRQLATFYDNFRLFVSIDIKRHKTS